MGVYLVRRFIGLAITLFLISFGVFLVLEVIPGDPAQIVVGIGAAPTTYQAVRAKLGLDRPVLTRYFDWLTRAVRGDLGRSLDQDIPISKLVGERMTVTLPLSGLAFLLALGIAFPLGMFTAAHHNRIGDYTGRFLLQLGMIVPEFWVGILLILFFSVRLHIAPAGGFPGWNAGSAAFLALILPAVALSLPRAALLGRMVRGAVLETLGEEYVQVARGKGLPESRVLYRHALRNALLPIVTLSGILAAQLIAGSILIENVFSLPGVGRLAFQAIGMRDLPLVQGTVVVIAALIAGVNFVVDLTYGLLDPRIRYQ